MRVRIAGSAELQPLRLEYRGPLKAVTGRALADFSAQGKRGKPAEHVAEEACSALLQHYRSGATLEQHLADQLIQPSALCRGESLFSVERISPHLVTNAWVVERFGLAQIDIAPAADGTGFVKILASR